MRIVPPEHATGGIKCAITTKTTDPDGFIRTGQTLPGWDQNVDLSIAAVKEMARMIGWHSPQEVDELLDRVRALEVAFEASMAQVDKLSRLRELEDELIAEVS